MGAYSNTYGIVNNLHCVKSVRIRIYSGLYLVQMRENANQNNSEYGHFLRSFSLLTMLL